MVLRTTTKKRAKGGPWVLKQAWDHVLFLHWPVEAEALSRLVPEPLELELRDDTAWLTVAALDVTILYHTFAELNVRTYVRYKDKTGVLFFTLDAGSPMALAARALYRLPYRWTSTRLARRDGEIWFDSRDDAGRRRWQLTTTYSGRGPIYWAEPGSTEEWLVERRRLLTTAAGRVISAEIAHEPWPLQRASLNVLSNTLLQAPAVRPLGEPISHYCRRLDVLTGPPKLES